MPNYLYVQRVGLASLRAPLELIPGVGHLAPMEDPGAFRSLLLRFLA